MTGVISALEKKDGKIAKQKNKQTKNLWSPSYIQGQTEFGLRKLPAVKRAYFPIQNGKGGLRKKNKRVEARVVEDKGHGSYFPGVK